MAIVVRCGSCKKTIKAAEKFAGKRVKCPGCQSVLSIPASGATAGSAAAGPKKPAPAPPTPVAANLLDDEIPIRQGDLPSQPDGNALASMLDDDIPVRQERPAAQPAGQTPSSCPGCGTAVSAGAVLCIDCGYDFRAQGKRSQQIGDGASGGKKKRKRQQLSGHSQQIMQLLRGCLFSFIGACVGAFIWYLVARFTLTEWALISWGLGGLAGLGMAAGYGHQEMFGGICAGVIAFLGIVIAKLAIFMWILGPIFAALAGMGGEDFTDEEFADEEFIAGEEFPGELDEEESSVEEAVDGAPMEESGTDEEYADEEYADEEYEEEIGAGDVVAMGASLFFSTMFGIYDILFIILACATAFKIGSSGNSGDF